MSDGLMCHYCRSYRCVCPESTGGEVGIERKKFELIPELKNIAKEVSAFSEDLGMELEFAIEVLQATASQAPAAPQVDVEAWRRIAFAKDGSTNEWSCWCEGCEFLRKHLPPAAAPVGQSYLYKEVLDLAKNYAAQPPSDISVLARAVVSLLGESSPQGWVRVEDGLPVSRMRVLILCDESIGQVAYVGERCGKKWMSDECPLNSVTHWQTLPAPPSAQPGEDGR